MPRARRLILCLFHCRRKCGVLPLKAPDSTTIPTKLNSPSSCVPDAVSLVTASSVSETATVSAAPVVAKRICAARLPHQ